MAPGGDNVLIYGHGPAFFVGVAYDIALYVAATIVIARAVRREQRADLARIATTVACFIPPCIAGVIYAIVPSLVGYVEIAPIGFILTAILLNWSLMRGRLFDLVPVAYDVLIERMSDGLLVLDERDRIVSANPARPAPPLVGARISNRGSGRRGAGGVSRSGDVAGCYRRTSDRAASRRSRRRSWRRSCQGRSALRRRARDGALHGKGGHQVGRLVVLRDVTDRVRAADELRIREARYRGLYRAPCRPGSSSTTPPGSSSTRTSERWRCSASRWSNWPARPRSIPAGSFATPMATSVPSLAVLSTSDQASDGPPRELALNVTLPNGEVRWILGSAMPVVESPRWRPARLDRHAGRGDRSQAPGAATRLPGRTRRAHRPAQPPDSRGVPSTARWPRREVARGVS